MTYSARRPYQKIKKSLTDFFKEPVRFLKESNRKESVFEKPYMDDYPEYQAMHLDLPNPDWPNMDWTLPGMLPGIKGSLGDISYSTNCKYCIITCYGDIASSTEECSDVYGWCHISVACTQNPQIGEANPGDVGWRVEGPVRSIEEDSMDGINIYVDWGAVEAGDDGYKTAHFVATLTDGLGNVCTDSFDVSCPSCQNPDCTVTGPATATSSSTAQYYVTDDGGCEIDWSVNGTDVSINSNGLVTLGANACGTFEVTAAVSGKCSDTKKVRVTDNGVWHLDGCPTNSGDNSSVCDVTCPGYVFVDYAICDANPVGTCTHGSSKPCASKVDSANGIAYADYGILCYWNDDCTYTTCNYSNYSWCPDPDDQTAAHSYRYTWECS